MLKKCLILALSLAAFSFAQDAYAPAPSDEVHTRMSPPIRRVLPLRKRLS